MRGLMSVFALMMCILMGNALANGVINHGKAYDDSLEEDVFEESSDTTASAFHPGETLRPMEYRFKNYNLPNQSRPNENLMSEEELKFDLYGPDVVKTVQRSLKARGYSIGEVDGVIGEKTNKALVDFQSSRGISNNGAINQSTLDALDIILVPESTIDQRKQIYSE